MFDAGRRSVLVAVVTSMFLAACGGGGTTYVVTPKKAEVALPTTAINGVFDGTINSTQPVTSLLLNDGSYYVVYSDAALPQRFTGLVTGSGTLNNGSISSDNGLNLSLLGTGTQSPKEFSLTSSYAEKNSWNGFLVGKASGESQAFATSYNSNYETLPAFSEIAGVYTGSIATKDIKEDKIELTVTADGKLLGKLSCGCTVRAKLVAQAGKLSYDATLAFDGGNHPLANKSMAGNVYFDTTSKRLYIVGKLSGTAENVIFVGNKA